MTEKTKQEQHEDHCRKEAVDANEKSITRAIEKKYFSSTKAGRLFIHNHLIKFAENISNRVDTYSNKQRTKCNSSQCVETVEYVIRDLAQYTKNEDGTYSQVPMSGEYYVAMIAMKAIIDVYAQSAKGKAKVIRVANRIGDTLNLEMLQLISGSGKGSLDLVSRSNLKIPQIASCNTLIAKVNLIYMKVS